MLQIESRQMPRHRLSRPVVGDDDEPVAEHPQKILQTTFLRGSGQFILGAVVAADPVENVDVPLIKSLLIAFAILSNGFSQFPPRRFLAEKLRMPEYHSVLSPSNPHRQSPGRGSSANAGDSQGRNARCNTAVS